MSVKQRREREKENLRQGILDAAREMFAEEGYKNVSMRKVAEKSNILQRRFTFISKSDAGFTNRISDC